eukprot:4000-Prorocentrum_minimum.AAC.2
MIGCPCHVIRFLECYRFVRNARQTLLRRSVPNQQRLSRGSSYLSGKVVVACVTDVRMQATRVCKCGAGVKATSPLIQSLRMSEHYFRLVVTDIFHGWVVGWTGAVAVRYWDRAQLLHGRQCAEECRTGAVGSAPAHELLGPSPPQRPRDGSVDGRLWGEREPFQFRPDGVGGTQGIERI